jgi:hypothetical protein
MTKFKIPKVKIKKTNADTWISYIIAILISSCILALVLISLPLTEKISSSTTYDLVNKNTLYWAKEYTLQLDTNESSSIENDIQKTRSILQKRLRAFGVERSQVLAYVEDDTYFLKVTIQSSRTQDAVENLITSPFIMRIVTQSDEIDYENEDDVLAPYLAENYIPTDFTRKDFRNIYITELKNSANEYSYFALFKTWPWQNKWNQFLKDYSGQTVGMQIDDFVTPVQIPTDQLLFAVPVFISDKMNAEITSIMFNSGIVPLNYSLAEEIEIPVDLIEADYIKLTEGILVGILLIYLYLFWVNKTPKDILLKSGLTSIITVSSWITYLKISNTPIDIFILAIQVITIVALIRIITENTESRIVVTTLLVLLSVICILFGSAYIKYFASDLLLLLIIANLAFSLTIYYIFNLKKSLKI